MSPADIQSYRSSFVGYVEGGPVSKRDLPFGVVFTRSSDGCFTATGFGGKALKPAFHLRFRSAEARDKYVQAWENNLSAAAARKSARSAERKAETHGFMKGTILVASWGYEQTNIDWYEVIAVVSDKTVVIRKIAASIESGCGYMSGNSVPVPGAYIGEPMRKRATSNGVSLTNFHGASPWDGKPRHCTWYA
jgi:hypothetical protein